MHPFLLALCLQLPNLDFISIDVQRTAHIFEHDAEALCKMTCMHWRDAKSIHEGTAVELLPESSDGAVVFVWQRLPHLLRVIIASLGDQ